MTEQLTEHVDILIIGAGPVGMTLNLALAAGGQRSLLLDSRPRAAQQDDPRALALAHGARQLLEQIRAWPTRAATPDCCRLQTIWLRRCGSPHSTGTGNNV